MDRVFVAIGAASGALAVGLGAFAAHGLEAKLAPRMLAVFETGVRYQMYHALALVLVGLFGRAPLAGWAFVIGTACFSGSLYALALGGPRFFGPITPLGGLAFIVGWGLFAVAALRGPT